MQRAVIGEGARLALSFHNIGFGSTMKSEKLCLSLFIVLALHYLFIT